MDETPVVLQSSMTLRDYFAASVIQGQIAKFGCTSDAEYDAMKAYALADAMIKHRDQS